MRRRTRDPRQPPDADARPAPGSTRRPFDIAVEIAGRQHGVVSRSQLREAGLSRRVIDGLRASRYLRVLHRGVYRVGAVVGPAAREFAAVLACGADALVSHWSAGSLWRLPVEAPPNEPVHVLVPWGRARVRPGIRAHRGRDLRPGDATTRDGVPVTTAPRTILDLAAELTTRELERVVARAERDRVVERGDLTAMLATHPRHPGRRALALVIGSGEPVPYVRSEAEQRLLAILGDTRLPAPRVNARVHGFEVDFYWPSERLIVEVDGFEYHGSRAAFRRDRRRDTALTNAGFRVVRLTWEDLTETPKAVLASIAQALVVR